MGSRRVLVSILVLRLLALLLLAGSIFILSRNKLTKVRGSFVNDAFVYKYVLATAVIAFFYTMIQVPCAAYELISGKMLIRKVWFPKVEFYGNKISEYLVATGIGAGFIGTSEFKSILNQNAKKDAQKEIISWINDYLDKANLGTAVLLLGFICMAAVSVFSSSSSRSSEEPSPPTESHQHHHHHHHRPKTSMTHLDLYG